ncbi:uric acid degradation bifunctional protein TTL isoform X2 [Physcomitrium patens]|uniref:Transthyretin/hydroxyisourate hydrolase domain-containing protein n=1 Tax=Physcomitrium patens TaxID=3218 RepID=A0A2K1KMW3_PHYPA|nr:uric acid degradation bifunctional protein TTL-like isoform X2 [Physcomitrium patens]PNR55118.1 hypothetical protein PHYPA_006011 [Physcomitrium patens]|eukprot:XP_024372429.1 uric acid degradation bifunctional protein TTL-like isoform X2 [Physcomitrella patens]
MTEAGFLGCCGSTRFAREMALRAPFSSLDLAVEAARDIWWNKVDVQGWLEAFAAHPRIGDIESLRTKFASERFCSGEQEAALSSANEHTLQELADWNRKYEGKFGHVFLICASGKSSSEILAALKERSTNRPIEELQNAASEQQKITELRLAKLMSSGFNSSGGDTQAVGPLTNVPKAAVLSAPTPSTAPASNLRPPITTHVLDVALGKPGSNIDVSLHFLTENSIAEGDQGSWTLVGNSQTDNDGRSGPLMQPSNYLQPGTYRITFNTGAYLARLHGNSGFYPCANVVFKVRPSQCAEHFHIPLLLAPYSYSTYRGS